MCTEPLYAIRLKTEFDDKFKRFKKRAGLKVLCAVRDIGDDTSKLDYDRIHYDLLMISCGQCLQCRLLRVKQRDVMCMCESLEHTENSFVTLTFGYPQLYSYFRHVKGLSHYLASKKAHFHEWSLDSKIIQNFIKRLRNWFYNYQLANHLISLGRSDLVPSSFSLTSYVSHIRIPSVERPFLLKDFKPKKIRIMYCGEYGSKKNRPHFHLILFGFQFPDLKKLYEKNQLYYTSEILSKLWTFGIHRIGECSYNSCAYVARYVTKKVTGNNMEAYYDGRKPEFIAYSTKPVLGANYFIKNYKEIVNTQELTVFNEEKYKCHMPKSYDNLLKKIDSDLYYKMKEDRVNNSLTSLEKLLSQKRSIYSKLDSGKKIACAVLKKLVRGFEFSESLDIDLYLKKAKAFGVNTKFFVSEFKDNAINYLKNKSYKDHISKSSNQLLKDNYYKFELARRRHITNCYNLSHSDERVISDLSFYINMPNPFRLKYSYYDELDDKIVHVQQYSRGRSLPDAESINENECIDELGRSYNYD